MRGLNAQIAAASTPLAASVVTAARLRKGNIDSGHEALCLIADSLVTLTRAMSKTLELAMVCVDSTYCRHDVITATTTGEARFSVTARTTPAVRRAIDGTTWIPIRYPEAVAHQIMWQGC